MMGQSGAGSNTENAFTADSIQFHPWRELSALALISLEISWLILWFEVFRRSDPLFTTGRAYLAFALNMAAAYLLARAMFLTKFRSSIRRGFLIGAYLLATAIFIQSLLGQQETTDFSSLFNRGQFDGEILLPVELILAFISAYMWLRGVSLAHSWLDPRVVIRSFSFGAGMLILLGFMTVFVKTPQPFFGLGSFALSGLIALGAARAASLGRLRGGRPISFNATWVVGILISTTTVAFLSIVIGSVAAGGFARWIAGIFMLLIRVILILAALLVSPLILLLLFSWPWFQSQAEASPLLQEIGRELARLVQMLMQLLVDLSRIMQDSFESFPDIQVLKAWFIRGAFAGLLVLMLVWFGKRWRLPWRRDNEPQEQASRLDPRNVSGRLVQSLREGIRDLGDQLRKVRFGPGFLGALRIRLLYARLMQLCDDSGTPRGETITPLEFLPTLENLFPQAHDDVRIMTEAYNRVRYGEIPETRGEVETVNLAWKRVKAEGARLHRIQRQFQPSSK